MKILLTLLSLAFSFLFLTSCEERQRTIEQGEIIQAPIIEKYTQGSNNPSKGLKKRYYVKVLVGPSQKESVAIIDRVLYNKTNVGDLVYGYYLDGNFVFARGKLRE